MMQTEKPPSELSWKLDRFKHEPRSSDIMPGRVSVDKKWSNQLVYVLELGV